LIVHIFDDTPHHYYPMQSFFSNKCTVKEKQFFLVRQPSTPAVKSDKQALFSFYNNNDELLIQLKQLPNSARVVFHGLFDLHLWRRLIFTSVVTRSSCVFWGAELYRHTQGRRSVKQHLAQLIHIALVKRLTKVVALNYGDALLVKRYLKRKEAMVLPYPLIGLKKSDTSVKQANEPLKFLVGNSAAKSNEHLFALKQLAHLSENNIEIIVPLNYAGSKEYVDEIMKAGFEIFGGKFKPITNMLDKPDYDKLLESVDFAIFSHQRQQGLYVVYAMFMLSKGIFLRQSTTSFSSLSSLGFDVQATEDLATLSFSQLLALRENITEKNAILMDEHFTEKALAPQWSEFLNGLSNQCR